MNKMTVTVTRTTTATVQGPVHYDEQEFREWAGHSNTPTNEEMIEFVESDGRPHWENFIEDVEGWKVLNTVTEYEMA